jgi:uncharacterized protein (UPF0335 family)
MDDPVQGDQLKSIIERIERLEEEKKTISDDIKEIYAEAKGNGYDVKVLRKVVALRKMDANERAEFEAILDLYMQAVGEYADTPLGRAAAPGFSSRTSMARSASSISERASRPAPDLETSKDTQARPISAPAGNGADQLVAEVESPEPDATPAGAVVAETSGVTAGETATNLPGSEKTSCPQREAQYSAEQQRDTAGVTGGERPASIPGLAEANAIAARAVQPAAVVRSSSGEMPDIPAFLRRAALGNCSPYGEHA